MSRSSHSPDFNAKVSQEYLDGVNFARRLAEVYGIGYSTLKGWIDQYRIRRISAFSVGVVNKHHSSEFKNQCVEEVLSGEGTVNDITAKYGISDRSVLRSWISKYNANRELKD